MRLPPRCPNPSCPRARRGPHGTRFFRFKGSFPKSAGRRVRRYQCRTCGRHFSEQTFRADYRQKRPDINAALARLAARGLGARTTARLLQVNRKTTALRLGRLTARQDGAWRPRAGGT